MMVASAPQSESAAGCTVMYLLLGPLPSSVPDTNIVFSRALMHLLARVAASADVTMLPTAGVGGSRLTKPPFDGWDPREARPCLRMSRSRILVIDLFFFL